MRFEYVEIINNERFKKLHYEQVDDVNLKIILNDSIEEVINLDEVYSFKDDIENDWKPLILPFNPVLDIEKENGEFKLKVQKLVEY